MWGTCVWSMFPSVRENGHKLENCWKFPVQRPVFNGIRGQKLGHVHHKLFLYQRMPRVERIPRDQIWFSGFSFTPSRNFPSSVRTLTTMSSNSGPVNAHLTSCPDANKIN